VPKTSLLPRWLADASESGTLLSCLWAKTITKQLDWILQLRVPVKFIFDLVVGVHVWLAEVVRSSPVDHVRNLLAEHFKLLNNISKIDFTTTLHRSLLFLHPLYRAHWSLLSQTPSRQLFWLDRFATRKLQSKEDHSMKSHWRFDPKL
jgi:hypothetical protein